MKCLFIEYPKCSTCKNAKKWLEEHNVEFEARNIIESTPTFEELKEWIKISGLPLKKFFNTSGMLYRELNLREKLAELEEDEQIRILSSNGMLIKRPILVKENKILVGFNQTEWEENL